MTRPTFLLDVDGVCADFASAVIDVVNSKLGGQRAHTVEHIDRWDIDIALGLNPNEAERMWHFVSREGFCASLLPYEDAVYGVMRLKEMAHVVVVTSPFKSRTWTAERETWLSEILGIAPVDVIHARAKQHVRGDVLIDDRPETLRQWHDCHPDGVPILFSRPWNRSDAWGGYAVDNWYDLIELAAQVLAGES